MKLGRLTFAPMLLLAFALSWMNYLAVQGVAVHLAQPINQTAQQGYGEPDYDERDHNEHRHDAHSWHQQSGMGHQHGAAPHGSHVPDHLHDPLQLPPLSAERSVPTDGIRPVIWRIGQPAGNPSLIERPPRQHS